MLGSMLKATLEKHSLWSVATMDEDDAQFYSLNPEPRDYARPPPGAHVLE